MSDFNPDNFLHQTTREELSTKRVVLPEGDYTGVVEKVEAGATPKGTPYLELTWAIEHPELESEIGRTKSIARQTIWLDLTASGDLDTGKGRNVGLGRLREAIGQNKSGEAWAPSMIEGAAATVKIKHRADKNDAELKFEEVKAVSAL